MTITVGAKTQTFKACTWWRRGRVHATQVRLGRRFRFSWRALPWRRVETRIWFWPLKFRPLHHRNASLRDLAQVTSKRARAPHSPFSRLSFAPISLTFLLLRLGGDLLVLFTISETLPLLYFLPSWRGFAGALLTSGFRFGLSPQHLLLLLRKCQGRNSNGKTCRQS